MSLGMRVNGEAVDADINPASRLSAVLRDTLNLKGTKVGCDAGDCGACSVIVDGEVSCACLVAGGQVAQSTIVTVEGIAWLLEQAKAVLPGLAEATFDRAWAGLRPVSRDGVPWIGPVPTCENLYLAAGHGRNGVLLSPITAERIRDDVMGKSAIVPTERISPARAFGDQPG